MRTDFGSNPQGVRWTLRNILVLALLIVPLICVLIAAGAMAAGVDTGLFEPRRFLGDLALLYPIIGLPLIIGGLIQSLVTLLAMRRFGPKSLLSLVLALVAFVPLLATEFIGLRPAYLGLPIVVAAVVYGAFMMWAPQPRHLRTSE